MSVNKSEKNQKPTSTTGLREGSPDKTRGANPETRSKPDTPTGMREGSPDKTRAVDKKIRK